MVYRGIVKNNDSPTRDGRVQVFIFGIHDENINVKHLPWAEVMQGIDFIGFHDNKPGIGKNTIIENGTWVFVILDHDNQNMPIVIGTVAAHNEINPKSNPLNQVVETVSGHLIEIDDNSGNERIHIKHKSGTDFVVNPDGSITEDIVSSENHHVTGKQTNKVDGGIDTNGGPQITMVAGTIFLN
jgi:hypothetical protein